MAEIVREIGSQVKDIFGLGGRTIGGGAMGIPESVLRPLRVYGPEALAQASDNLWSLIPGTLLSKILETAAGGAGVLVTEFLPQVRANPMLYDAFQRFFAHWVTKILDPTPQEWTAMANEAKNLFSKASFANPTAKLTEIATGIQQNLQKLAGTFALPKTFALPGMPDIGAWFQQTFGSFGSIFTQPIAGATTQVPLPTFQLATQPVPAQALIQAPPGQITRSVGLSTTPPALAAPSFAPVNRTLFQLSAGIAR